MYRHAISSKAYQLAKKINYTLKKKHVKIITLKSYYFTHFTNKSLYHQTQAYAKYFNVVNILNCLHTVFL